MKKYLSYVLFAALLTSCNTGDTHVISLHSTAVSVVMDATDKKLLWPLAIPVLQVYRYPQFPDAEGWFDLSVITDKVINISYSFHLPDAQSTEQQNTEDDPQYRSKAIVGFYTDVKNSFTNIYKEFDTGKTFQYSECWSTISSALSKLNHYAAVHKYLFVFSDLAEHNELWNAYSHDKSFNNKSVAAIFLKAYQPPQDLKNITVVFVFRPRTRAEDKRYTTMLGIYKFILEERGATLVVQTNNSNYNL